MQVGNNLDLQGNKLINQGDPSSGTDGANKQYVDSVARGLAWKDSVRAASTANGTLASAYENADTLDGVTLATGDRILLKNQTAGAENGIYTVNASGAPTRALDADSATELKAATVTVTEGSTNADKVFRLVTDNVTLGTTSLSWTEVGGGGSTYVAGDGLGESPAGTFNVTTGTGLEVSSDSVRIAAAAAGAGLTGGAGSALAVGAGTGITVNADDVALASTAAGAGLTHTSGVLDVVGDASITVGANSLGLATGVAGAGLTLTTGVLDVVGGTGITVSANSVAVSSVVVRAYAATIGDGSTTNIVVTHNLGTQDIQVTVREVAGNKPQVLVDNEATTTNTATIKFATAPTTNQYRVIIQGAA